MGQLASPCNTVTVRPYAPLEWAWEVIDPKGVTIAQGRAWTYSDAVTRAWTAERTCQEPPARRRR
jgi:hypothetical protein